MSRGPSAIAKLRFAYFMVDRATFKYLILITQATATTETAGNVY